MGLNRGLYIDEELYLRARQVAKALGYRSFNAFVNDLLRDAIVTYEAMVRLREQEEKKRERRLLSFVFLGRKLSTKA